MKLNKRILILAATALLLPACQSASTASQPVLKVEVGRHDCTDPRPQMCTMDYRPSCGLQASGAIKTYANGCGACADAEVLSYTEGACE